MQGVRRSSRSLARPIGTTMRTLGVFALVLASLAFSAGGVAVVGRADSPAPTGDASVERSAAPAQTVAPTGRNMPLQCGVPVARTQGPKLYRNGKRPALPRDAVMLNTHGYNYGAQVVPDAQPPAAQDPGAPAPAAPEKR